MLFIVFTDAHNVSFPLWIFHLYIKEKENIICSSNVCGPHRCGESLDYGFKDRWVVFFMGCERLKAVHSTLGTTGNTIYRGSLETVIFNTLD
jgi:hypothetical protein